MVFFISVLVSTIFLLVVISFGFPFVLNLLSVGVDSFGISLSFSYSSSFFSACLLVIYTAIFYFSLNYFGSNSDFGRFSLLFFSFVASMMLLINHSSIFTLFIGWDGLGLSSYFLVAYYMNWSSINGAMVTVLSNRFGDFCLLWFFSSLVISGFSNSWIVPFLIVLGLSTNSAQFPFSSWLPLAIAAPTPVSSLVHSSTLVTAGYYLMFCYYSILIDSTFLFLMVLMGVTTIFLSGISSLFESDLKNVIALSTLSQIGFLVMSLGLGLPLLSFLHMLSHAFFNSCMFVQVGILISLSFSSQESRAFSTLCVGNPLLSFILVSCTLSLCGQLFLSGFFSNEPVLVMSGSSSIGLVLFFIILIGVIFTFLYSTRILFGIVSPSVTSINSSLGMDYFLFSVPLWIFGLFSGYFSLQNSNIILTGFIFAENFLLLILPISAMAMTFSFLGFFGFFRGILFLDYLTSSVSNVLINRLKSLDFFFISSIKFFIPQMSRIVSYSSSNFLVFNFNLFLWGSFLFLILV